MRTTEIVTLRTSAAQSGAGTVTGSVVKLQYPFTEALILLDVTAAATSSDDTLDVYIDTSPDGGTTWINVGHFTQALGNGGTKKYAMALKANPIASSNVVDAEANQSAGDALQIGFADRLRYRGVVADPSGTDAEFTYEIKAFLK